MMQKPWFKLIIWFLATAFFFSMSGFIISYLNPEPSERQIMLFMSGMMKAMDNSLMGLSMSLESDYTLKSLILAASQITIPLLFISTIAAVIIRIRRRKNDS